MNLDLESLNLIDLSPTQYIILHFIAHNKNLNDIVFYKHDINMLVERGLLESRGGILFLTVDSSSLFSEVNYEESWNELRRTYPKKSGIRRLQNSLEKTKRRYLSMLKRGEAIHSEVIKAINIEKIERENALITRTWMADWKALSTYVNNKEWETFLEEDETEQEEDLDKI
tara:strand:+ start:510 stop:1022 length:513 start_codon:yes stop_codon:yes gene_type:complete